MPDRTPELWINFYAKGNGSVHFTRDAADQMADFTATENPRLACVPVSARIGEGLAVKETI